MVPFGSTRVCFLVRKEGLLKFCRNWTFKCEVCGLEKTRGERLKSAPYLRLKKRKTFFWKKLNFLFQKLSHSAEKRKGRTFLDLLTYIPLQNIKKLEGGSIWGHKKISKKSRTVPKKSKGGTLEARPVL